MSASRCQGSDLGDEDMKLLGNPVDVFVCAATEEMNLIVEFETVKQPFAAKPETPTAGMARMRRAMSSRSSRLAH
jgi:hypothetical protein